MRLPALLTLFVVGALSTRAADLSALPREIAREPKYQGQARYALAVFGPEADFRVWLVKDGDVLYADKNGNGDLTEPGEKITPTELQYEGLVFKVGDIVAKGHTYADVRLRCPKLKDYKELYGGLPDYQAIIAADPEAPGYYITAESPPTTPLSDEKGRAVSTVTQTAGMADADGVLQFAARPDDAPILHFGGPWEVRPYVAQKFVLGREDEFTAVIGTPGLGPGTLAVILYHTQGDDATIFVPRDARLVLDVEFPGAEGRTIPARLVLEDRC
jgi:hypothetical protein